MFYSSLQVRFYKLWRKKSKQKFKSSLVGRFGLWTIIFIPTELMQFLLIHITELRDIHLEI